MSTQVSTALRPTRKRTLTPKGAAYAAVVARRCAGGVCKQRPTKTLKQVMPMPETPMRVDKPHDSFSEEETCDESDEFALRWLQVLMGNEDGLNSEEDGLNSKEEKFLSELGMDFLLDPELHPADPELPPADPELPPAVPEVAELFSAVFGPGSLQEAALGLQNEAAEADMLGQFLKIDLPELTL